MPAARALGAGETRNVKDPVFICLVLGGGIVCLLVFNTNSLAVAILVYNQPHFLTVCTAFDEHSLCYTKDKIHLKSAG